MTREAPAPADQTSEKVSLDRSAAAAAADGEFPAPPARRRWPRSASIYLDTAVTMVALLVVWIVLALLVNSGPLTKIPLPWDVAKAFGSAWPTQGFGAATRGGLLVDILTSLKEGLVGWVLGCGTATIIGVLAGRIQPVARILMPVLEVLRPISPIVWVPLAMIWFGIGFQSKLFIVALTTFFIVLVPAFRGARQIDPEVVRVARMVGMGRARRLVQVEFMAAVPDVLIGWRLALAAAWGGVVIAELVAANSGLGQLQFLAIQAYDVPTIVVGMVCFAALGLITNALFLLAERRLFAWSPSVRADRSAATVGGEA